MSETDEAATSVEVPTDGAETPVEKTFTQAELDELIKTRLAREAKKFADYAELKAFKQTAERDRTAALTEQEQAIEAAKLEGANAVKREYAIKLVEARLETVLTGVVDDPISIVSDLNTAKYMEEDGTPNETAIAELKKRYMALLGKKAPASVGHGRASSAPAGATPQEEFAQFLNHQLGRT